ncbi:MAG TPA: GntR family transcriptional regulator [Candidatus Baltobacteraceae bacterium]|jgi:GntR family transcriptional regulator|nr:GntR family transcriptional regulator [Candidatus Baltobacteraceae bacterium]
MPVVLTVDPRSGVPIYLQVIEQVKRSVAIGILSAGEQLPTVKQLALDLTINPNTVAKAYRELERDGVIETAAGRGSFVRGNGSVESTKTAAKDVARDALETAVRDAKSLGLNAGDVRTLTNAAIDRWFQEGQ